MEKGTGTPLLAINSLFIPSCSFGGTPNPPFRGGNGGRGEAPLHNQRLLTLKGTGTSLRNNQVPWLLRPPCYLIEGWGVTESLQ